MLLASLILAHCRLLARPNFSRRFLEHRSAPPHLMVSTSVLIRNVSSEGNAADQTSTTCDADVNRAPHTNRAKVLRGPRFHPCAIASTKRVLRRAWTVNRLVGSLRFP